VAKFVKGQSGNPTGRPKDVERVSEAAREHTQEAIERLVAWMKSDNPKASVSACNALLDRGWGRPAQTVEAGPELAKILFAWAE
jgi:hypothetical protein